jgi:hypothetical protein
MDTTDGLQLRAWLAKQLKKDDVPDSLWRELEDERHVSEVRQGIAPREYLLEKARHIVRRSREITSEWQGESLPLGLNPTATSEVTDSASQSKPAQLSGYERQRAQAYAEYLAKTADAAPVVQNFRHRILGVEKLPEEQVWELVSSQALCYLSPSWFLAHNMPVLGSKVQIVSEQKRIVRPEPTNPFYLEREAELVVEVELPDGHKETEEISIAPNQQPDKLVLPYTKGLPRREFRVWRSSVLGILSNLSKTFAEHYPWREEDAAWFVLTGEVPEASLLAWITEWQEYTDQQTITLTVDSWVSVETVASLYSELRRYRLGRNTRRLSERNLDVFRFVITQLKAPSPDEDKPLFGGRKLRRSSVVGRLEKQLWELEGPSWRTLLEQWNQAHPGEWSYEDVRLFSRDFYRAHKAIARPYKSP